VDHLIECRVALAMNVRGPRPHGAHESEDNYSEYNFEHEFLPEEILRSG
jgi:hypothetical protein